MPLTGFSSGFSPQILQPYPIDTQIAQGLMQGNPIAPMLSAKYSEMHNVGEAQYGEQFNQMRNMQYYALQQQMMDNAVKAIDSASKSPGGMEFLAQAFPGLLGGTTQDSLNQYTGRLGTQFNITNLKNLQDASKAGAEAGTPISSQTISGLTNLPVASTTPLALQTTDLAGRYKVAAAQAGGAALRTVTVQTGQLGPNHMPLTTEAKYSIYWPPEVQQAAIDAQVKAAREANLTAGGMNTPPDARAPGTAPTGAPGGGMDVSSNPLLGPLNGGPANTSPLGTSLPPNTSPADSLTPPPAQVAPAQTNTSAGSPGQQKATPAPAPAPAPAPQKLPDTKPKQLELPDSKYNIALQGRALQGLAGLRPADRDEINSMRQHLNFIPIRRLNGVEVYIGKDGRTIGQVPS